MEPNAHLPRRTRKASSVIHPARASNGTTARVLKDDIVNGGHRSYGRNLTLFAVTVVVAMSDLIVQQERNITGPGIFVLIFEFCDLFLKRSLVLFGK
jgi:hypothetical protein